MQARLKTKSSFTAKNGKELKAAVTKKVQKIVNAKARKSS